MSTGGLHPRPAQMGGGVPTVQRILEELNAARGTAYDTSRSSNVYVENLAFARALFEVWALNQRLGNIWQPTRLTEDILSRWERILGLSHQPTDVPATRRARVAAHMLRFGLAPTMQRIYDALSGELGTVFVTLNYRTISEAVAFWPGNSYPNDFSSTLATILIKTQKPTGFTEADFYNAVARIQPLMDSIAPAWVTWHWYRNVVPAAVGVWATDTGAGFYLDTESNLDNQIFDV